MGRKVQGVHTKYLPDKPQVGKTKPGFIPPKRLFPMGFHSRFNFQVSGQELLKTKSVLVEFLMKFLQNGSTFPRHFVDTECTFCHFITELAAAEPYFIVEKSLTIV